jgi:ABC-type Fe3+-hydroxamate transport system substrate-binding protein
MPRLATLLLVTAVAASCGGKSGSSSSTSSTTPEGPAGGGAKLPWEAAFTTGATFTLVDGMTAGMPDAETLTVKVTNVEDKGSERVYSLEWSDGGNGLQKIIVRADGSVGFDDVPQDGMQDPFETPVGMCYGEDLSNPDGCDDVCDGHICMSTAGIVTVSGLYAPGYSEYVAK